MTQSPLDVPLDFPLNFPLSIAPMMDYTDRHYRMLMRFFTKKTVCYTEMISTGAILHGDRERHLAFSLEEKPLILQIGGDGVEDLAECTRIAAGYGYDEININVGCPSERVQQGSFGASLMAKSSHVGRMVEAMCATNTIPVSVKCRIGIDGSKVGLPVKISYKEFRDFADVVMQAGSTRLIVHARIAILGGLSPKENREIPPLNYDWVYRLAKECPHYRIEINGGIDSLVNAHEHLAYVDGSMIGRAAVDNMAMFNTVDTCFVQNKLQDHDTTDDELSDISYRYAQYLESIGNRVYIAHAIRHLIPLYNSRRGARKWRQALSMQLQSHASPMKAVSYAHEYSRVGMESVL